VSSFNKRLKDSVRLCEFCNRYYADRFLDVDGGAKTGKWVLFILPFITVLREGWLHFYTRF